MLDTDWRCGLRSLALANPIASGSTGHQTIIVSRLRRRLTPTREIGNLPALGRKLEIGGVLPPKLLHECVLGREGVAFPEGVSGGAEALGDTHGSSGKRPRRRCGRRICLSELRNQSCHRLGPLTSRVERARTQSDRGRSSGSRTHVVAARSRRPETASQSRRRSSSDHRSATTSAPRRPCRCGTASGCHSGGCGSHRHKRARHAASSRGTLQRRPAKRRTGHGSVRGRHVGSWRSLTHVRARAGAADYLESRRSASCRLRNVSHR